jgi:hypothetical protein
VTVILFGSEPAKPDSQLPMTQHQGASVENNENNKDPNQKQPGEKEPGTFHYNPGNMSGKTIGAEENKSKQSEAGETTSHDDDQADNTNGKRK